MALHQFNIKHDQVEDRLLLRLSSTEGEEFRFWLTRRFVDRLWGLLVTMLGWDEAVIQQVDAEARRNVLEIRHEGYAQESDFTKQYQGASRLPLGDAPVLLATAKGGKRGEGLHIISLLPEKGRGIDITLDSKLLHLFARLLRESVAKAEWGMNLRLQPDSESRPAAESAPRKLN
jgi:hypothetical protein